MEPLATNPKLDAFLDLIEDNYQGTKFVIWSPFVHEIEHIAQVLRDKYGHKSVECYYGATDKEYRSTIEDRYCKDPEMRFFVGNPAAAGLGLTLISGENDVEVYYSSTEAYIERAQSEDRCHRIGQKNSVVIVDIVMENSVDQVIYEANEAKMDIEAYVMMKVREGDDVWSKMLG